MVTPQPSQENANDIAIDVEGLTKSFDSQGRRAQPDDAVAAWTDPWVSQAPTAPARTTTIRMLCGLLTPDSGRGSCLGFDIRTQHDEIKRHVGYMTQRFSLYEDLSIRENLEFVARIYGVADPVDAAQRSIRRLGLVERRTSLRANCPAAGSRGWRSAPASCPRRTSCCSTNRRLASIRRRAATSGTRFIVSRKAA